MYFIPLRLKGGEPQSWLCDPIVEIKRPGRVDGLVQAAGGGDWPLSPWAIGLATVVIGIVLVYVVTTPMRTAGPDTPVRKWRSGP